jgi:uncharacterized protein YjlB
MKSLVEAIQPIQNLNITRHIFTEEGQFPNNGLLPLLIYRKALHIPERQEGNVVQEILESNSWTNAWQDGIYDYHHYHSTAHEVLVISEASARVQFGGPNGMTFPLEKGDVVIIPAGVAHKKIDETEGFRCIGAYPAGQDYDMNYGKEGERPGTDENIKKVPLAESDPLYGVDGPLIKNWSGEINQSSSVL